MALDTTKSASVSWMMAQYENEPSHPQQVCKLALQLFDQLHALHQLKESERDLLEAAALLHDIGWYHGEKGHHKSTMKMIWNAELDGWSKSERQMMANIARYHRKSPPAAKHKKFYKLSKPDKIIVKKLAALLRIADGLDRSHTNAVDSIECAIDTNSVALTLYGKGNLSMERAGFEKKRQLFTDVYRIGIHLEKTMV